MKNESTPWQCPPVHPAAEKLPMMSGPEIDELAADIKANGLEEPITVWTDNKEEANGSKGPFPKFVLDGRNRLEALGRIGIKNPDDAPLSRSNTLRAAVRYRFAVKRERGKWVTEVDPEIYVLSANVHRRHLTAEQKREAIAAFIKADPKASDRKIAETLKVDHKTVGAVRKGRGVPNGEIPQMEHSPVERAKVVVRANPGASVSDIAETAKVGRATAQRAQKQVAAERKTKPAPPFKVLPPPPAPQAFKVLVAYSVTASTPEDARELVNKMLPIEAIVTSVRYAKEGK